MELKDMIYKGLCDGTVKIIIEPYDDYIACQIGDYWFYFIEEEYQDLTPYEIYEIFTKAELTDMIFNTLSDFEKVNEFNYCKSFLEEKYGEIAELKSLISKGLDTWKVKLVELEPSIDRCVVCQIADKKFLFLDEMYEELTQKQVFELFSKEELVDMIVKQLLIIEKTNPEDFTYIKDFLSSPVESDPNSILWDALKSHLGHNVKIVCYGELDNPNDICLECEDCGEVILDAELYTLCAREDV